MKEVKPRKYNNDYELVSKKWIEDTDHLNPQALSRDFPACMINFVQKLRVQSWGSWLEIRNQQKINSVVYFIYASGHF